ncbi:hypothetical protein [Streptomyces nojiriensis]|uniref:hypothetical protein n=1 Tax=Streptomyces nojiriensis TaxID=66374 RepID=UPI001673196C|nr:hypothetical protein [Streptomyces nojiriensis]
MTEFNGTLWYPVTGAGGAVYWRTFTEAVGWSAITRFRGYMATTGRTLATHAAGCGCCPRAATAFCG